MKSILGLDLGSSSIGWALISVEGDKPMSIIDMGCRIIPLSTKERDGFIQGNGESVNQQRTIKRTQRKIYDRYCQRREKLKCLLAQYSMMPDDNLLLKSQPIQLYRLRSKAVTEKISLQELGRVLYLLNQKRGYKSSRKDESGDKKDTEYVKAVKDRHEIIKNENLTVGQWLYSRLSENSHFRIKDIVFPREAYLEEFNRIWSKQKEYHSELTDELLKEIRDAIIFYQRPLKSQKGLVSVCKFESRCYVNKEGKQVFNGPKVAPKSSPLFQLCNVWEVVNNIRIGIKRTKTDIVPSLISDGKGYATLTIESKRIIANELQSREKLSKKDLFKLLKINESDGYTANEQINSGLPGNRTLSALSKAIKNNPNKNSLLSFNLSEHFEQEPLYRLWHCIYSIDDKNALINKLTSMGVSIDEAIELSKLDFTKAGSGNKSSKAICKILPYLQEGYGYSDACANAGYNHSNSITKEENEKRELLDKLDLLPKNSLRQPVVEKILNQMIHLVNDLLDKYGKPDEIRVELARELKQSKVERYETLINNRKRERENQLFAEKAREYGRANKRNIQKMRMHGEVGGMCLYCGKGISIEQFINGIEADIEHIIPRSLYYDDSQQNKIPAHRACNSAKGNLTAYEYLLTKADEEINRYEEQVNKLYVERKISKKKKNNLLMKISEIPEGFLTRQINETRYITRKSVELLKQICKNVYCTTGIVTERLRHLWGWDDILMNTHINKYRDVGLTEIKEYQSNGNVHKKEVIKDWSKRDDHRHHAIDALTVACTRQGFIQRWNTLSTQKTRNKLQAEVEGYNFNGRLTLLEKYLVSKQAFTTEEVKGHVENILISQKAGKKLMTYGIRKYKQKKVQENIIIPRGTLHEESIYGKISIKEHNVPVKKLFENPGAIFKQHIKELIINRLSENNNDIKKAIASLKTNPIFLREGVELTHTTIHRDEYVIRKPLQSLDEKQIDKIIDERIKELIKQRIKELGKDAFKDFENNPLWLNKEKGIKIKSVRIATGLSAVVPLKRDEKGEAVSYVKPGNNHHIAIYKDKNGNLYEHVVSFWQAVERKKNNIPTVIEKPSELWTQLLNRSDLTEEFLKSLPTDDWEFIVSMQQNEMFVFGLDKEILETAVKEKDYKLISKHLYRVQKLSSKNYYFRHHLETKVDDNKGVGYLTSKKLGKLLIVVSLKNMTGIKIRIDKTGGVNFQ